jgi:hypothetical protein
MLIFSGNKNNQSKYNSTQLAVVVVAIFLAAALSLQNDGRFGFPIQDAFHHGEFLAAAITVLEGAPFEGPPYTIHGAVDFFPAIVVNLFLPSRDMLLANTLVLYPMMTMLAVVLIAFAAIQLTRRFDHAPLVVVPFILIAGLCVGWRDIFFALSLYMFARIVPDERGQGGGAAAQILFGLVIALSTYWSFNRGVAALAAFAPPTLWLAVQHRRFLISITSAVVGFLVMGATLPGIGVVSYVENFLMLLQTSSQWRYPRSPARDIWAALIIGCTLFSFIIFTLKSSRNALSGPRIILLIALLSGCAVYAKIGLGRIDGTHIVMGIWLPVLVVTLLLPSNWLEVPSWPVVGIAGMLAVGFTYFASGKLEYWPLTAIIVMTAAAAFGQRFRLYTTAASLALSIAVVFLTVGRTYIAEQRGFFDWVRAIPDLPIATQAVTPGVLWSASTLVENGAPCVFDLVNTGLINAVANLPACSRFTYPVYAGPQHEARLIEDLRRSAPPVIVYSAEYWSYAIDGRSMKERFRALDAEILLLYPRKVCDHGYCLRFSQ